MKLSIPVYKTKRIPQEPKEVFIPTEPFYCFQTGVRRSIRMVPEFYTWEPSPHDPNPHKLGDVYQLHLTVVYGGWEGKAGIHTITIHSLSEYISRRESGSSNIDKENEINSLMRAIVDEHYEKRTKQQFESDLSKFIDKTQPEAPTVCPVVSVDDLAEGNTIILTGYEYKQQVFTIKDIVLSPEGDKEVILDRDKNIYFNLNMFLEGDSWVKELYLLNTVN